MDVSPEADRRRLGGADPVPRARRRQPRADGLEHAAAGRAAARDRAAARRHRAWRRAVAQNSGMVVSARKARHGRRASTRTRDRRSTDDDVYELRKFAGLNERTCLNQRPIVEARARRSGRARSSPTAPRRTTGELALGRNVLVAFMPWDGYNFEDAILVSRAPRQGRHLHLDPHRRVRDRDPRDEARPRGVHARHPERLRARAAQPRRGRASCASGTRVAPGDILVGKVAPKSKSELSPEEKLLHAIFGRAGEDVKNDSLEVPPGVEGIVIDDQEVLAAR